MWELLRPPQVVVLFLVRVRVRLRARVRVRVGGVWQEAGPRRERREAGP